MNAVLVDLKIDTSPMCVYTRIQEYQKHILYDTPSKTFRYLISSQTNGTFMSLPSGICSAFNSYRTGKKVTVCYTTNFGTDQTFRALIEEESGRITDLEMVVKPDSDLPETDWSYVLVLVNGRHWIAVKHIKVEKKVISICYDPANGNAETDDSMTVAIQKLGYTPESINGLYICIP